MGTAETDGGHTLTGSSELPVDDAALALMGEQPFGDECGSGQIPQTLQKLTRFKILAFAHGLSPIGRIRPFAPAAVCRQTDCYFGAGRYNG